MELKYKISRDEYLKLMFIQTYRRPLSILVLIFGIYSFFQLTKFFLFGNFTTRDLILPIYGVLFCLIIFPAFIFIRSRNFYNSHKILGLETLTVIDKNGFSDSGEGFEAKILWENIYKIKELKDWILVYHNSTAYGFLPKRVLTKSQIQEFRDIIIQKNIKSELRTD